MGYYKICDYAGNCNETSGTPIKINYYKKLENKTNGSWYIWNTPGYIGVEKKYCNSYVKSVYTGNCVNDTTFVLNHGVGTTVENTVAYVRIDSDGNLADTDGSGANLFILIYLPLSGINKNGFNGCYWKNGDISDCNLKTTTINNSTYYGVWIKATCNQDGRTCPPAGISLH